MDLVQYGQYYNDAMAGMDSLFDEMKESMKYFNKKGYPDVFEGLMRKYGKVLLAIEAVYDHEENKEKWLKKLAERFVSSANDLLHTKKWKFQRNNMLIDCNMFVVGYVIPLILASEGNMSKPFAQTVVDHWNETFGTALECGDFDRIASGFKTRIFGINLEK